MKDSALRELASMAFLGTAEGDAAQRYALEKLPRRFMKKYQLYLKNEIKNRRVMVKLAGAADDNTKKTFAGVFAGKEIIYSTDPELGAGIEVEHGDNIAKINVQNIIDRAINGIKESL
jgi:hypothetical protein